MNPTASSRPSGRVHRTQQALLDALLDLIVEKGYERTTVEDILRRADVGRTAFYDHFANKQDLLLRRFGAIPWVQRGYGAAGPFDVTFLFAHIFEQRELVAGLRGTAAYDEAIAQLRSHLLQGFTQLLPDRGSQGNDVDDLQLTAQALTGALMQLLLWWIGEGMPETPATMANWFAQLSKRMVEA